MAYNDFLGLRAKVGMFSYKTQENGFEYIEIINDSAQAKIALQGAHLFHYQKTNEKPTLWLSDTTCMENGKNIRGGVPICWPSFGHNNPDLPAHGFARNQIWNVLKIIEDDTDTTIVVLDLKDSLQTKKMWAYQFHVTVHIRIAKELSIELVTLNKDVKDFKLTQAFHSYFAVSDVKNISIKGLENKPYLDTVTNTEHIQNGTLKIDKEVDFVYQEVDKGISLEDATRTIDITAEGSSSSVIWNPWVDKSKRMSGMRDDSYDEFICIETANAFADYKILHSGQSHRLKVTII